MRIYLTTTSKTYPLSRKPAFIGIKKANVSEVTVASCVDMQRTMQTDTRVVQTAAGNRVPTPNALSIFLSTGTVRQKFVFDGSDLNCPFRLQHEFEKRATFFKNVNKISWYGILIHATNCHVVFFA